MAVSRLGLGISLLVTAAAILAATEGVLRLVARRPAVVNADPDYDAASRRLSAQRVLRGAQLVLSSCLGVVLIIGGDAIVEHAGGADGAPLLAIGYLVAAAGLVIALVPARPPLHPTVAGPAWSVANQEAR